MRKYPENLEELEQKHGFIFPIDEQKLERIQDQIILRHDLVYLFLKSRILNGIKEQYLFKDEVFLNSFMDREFNQGDRIKIYNAIKNRLPFPMEGTKAVTIRILILNMIGWNKNDIKANFKDIFKDDIENFKIFLV